MKKLRRLGIRDNTNNLIDSYLSETVKVHQSEKNIGKNTPRISTWDPYIFSLHK